MLAAGKNQNTMKTVRFDMFGKAGQDGYPVAAKDGCQTQTQPAQEPEILPEQPQVAWKDEEERYL